jgi:hypothetical protein
LAASDHVQAQIAPASLRGENNHSLCGSKSNLDVSAAILTLALTPRQRPSSPRYTATGLASRRLKIAFQSIADCPVHCVRH